MTAASRARAFWDVPESPDDTAWVEKRRLASALRELVGLCVMSEAPDTTLSYAADAVARVAERLRAHPLRTFQEGIASCKTQEDFARFADRSTIVGQSNPFAPPAYMTMEGDVAVARVTFGPPFEGIPGHVHGGIVAAAFDQLFGYLQSMRGVGSLTGELTVRYKRPTPLLVPLRLEARVEAVNGRRSTLVATMKHEDVVTAEASGLFVAVDPSRLHAVIERGKRDEG